MSKHFLLSLLALALMSTSALAQVPSLYLYESFEQTSGTALPAGWDASDYQQPMTAVGKVAWVSNTGGAAADGSVSTTERCASYNSVNNAFSASYGTLKTPGISLPAGGDALLSFKFRTTGTTGNMEVYVSTDGGQTYTGNALATGLRGSNTYQEYQYMVRGFGGQTIKIVFLSRSAANILLVSSGAFYIDDVKIESAPTCQATQDLFINRLSETGATLNWGLKGTGFGAVPDSFNIELLDHSGATIRTDSIGASTLYTFTGLTPGTDYTARVQSDCRHDYNGMAGWSSIEFRTLPPALQLPYHEDFDTLTQLPDGAFGANATINTSATYAYGVTGRSVKLTTTASQNAYICLPMLDARADTLEIEFKLRAASASAKMLIYAGYSTDPSDATATLMPIVYDTIIGSTEWRTYRFNTAATADTTSPVGICIAAMAGTASSVYIDHVSARYIPSCVRPERLTVEHITTSAVLLSWQTATADTVRLRAVDGATGTVLTGLATSSPYLFTGLAAATTYTFTATSVCSASDTSDVSEPVTATTLCTVADSAIVAESFDLTATNTAPLCWSMGWMERGESAAETPFSTTTAHKHGDSGRAAILNRQAAGVVSYLSTQCLPVDSAGKYDVALWVYRQNAATYPDEHLEVWVNTVADDTVGGICLGRIPRHYLAYPAELSADWHKYQYAIPTVGNIYIMIVGHSQNGADLCFDDFSVALSPSCRQVADIRLDTVSDTDATISWRPTGSETQWIVNYRATCNEQIVDTTVVAAHATLTIDGLLSSSSYELEGSVRAYCGTGDTAEAREFRFAFNTACAPVTRLPYTIDFEQPDPFIASHPLPICWGRVNNAATYNYYPYIHTVNPRGGDLALYHYQSSGSAYPANPAVVLPEAGVETNTLRLVFYACLKSATSASACSGTAVVGVMSDPEDISTFVDVDTIYITETSYARFVVPFTAYAGAGRYAAIRFPKPASGNNYVIIDDLTLELTPSCPDIAGDVRVHNVSDNAATVTIADASAFGAWSAAFGPEGTPADSMTEIDATDSSVVLTGLTATTRYEVRVRRICGTSRGVWSDPIAFSTTVVPAQAPYVCDFENNAENVLWQRADAAGTNRFVIGSAPAAVYDGSQALYVSKDAGQSHSYTITSASQSYAYRTLALEDKVYRVSFRWRCAGGQTNVDYGRAMLVSSDQSIMGDIPVTGIYKAFDPEDKAFMNLVTSGWNLYSDTVDLRGAEGIYNLVFEWRNDASIGTDGPLAVDNISITPISCMPPRDIVVSGLAVDSVTLTYAEPGVTGWEIIVDDKPFDETGIPAEPLFRARDTVGTLRVGGLTANTEYYCSARAICQPGDTGEWRQPVTFRTRCTIQQLPYESGFESVADVGCWSVAGITGTSGTVSHDIHRRHIGNSSMHVDRTTAVSPEFDVDTLAQYYITGYVYALTAGADFGIGVMTDPEDPTTFELLANVNVASKNHWEEFTAYFTALADPDYADFSNARFIALSTNSNSMWFDDLRVEHVPSCPKPTEPVISGITDSSFTISFVDNAAATQWVVTTNGRPNIISTNPATISGLNHATDYDVSVAAICQQGDTSAYISAGTVSTACAPMTLPWVCSFEQSEGFNRLSKYFAYQLEEHCWNVLNDIKTSGSYPKYMVSPLASAAHTGKQGLSVQSSNTTADIILILPEFADSLAALRLTFYYRYQAANANYKNFQVGYVTDPEDNTSFVMKATLAATSSNWCKYQADISTFDSIPAGARLAIKQAKMATKSTTTYSFLDDIVVERVSACPSPNVPEVSVVTHNSAEVTFEDTVGTRTAWEYAYGPAGFDADEASMISTTQRTFTLSGLDADTRYEVAVRALCDSAERSAWIKTTFRTACRPYDISRMGPFADSFEDMGDSEILSGCYTQQGDTASNFVQGWLNTFSPATAATPYEYHYARTGDVCLKMPFSTTTTPNGLAFYHAFRFEAGRTYHVEVGAMNATQPAVLEICLGTTPDYRTMRLLASELIPQQSTGTLRGAITIYDYTTGWRTASNYFTVPETGDYYIGIRGSLYGNSTSVTLYIDDFSVNECTGCSPSAITVDSVTTSTAYVTMDRYVADGHYEYYVADLAGDTVVGLSTVDTGKFVIQDLPHSSILTLRLRHICSDGAVSPWADARFTTDCAPFAITLANPYIDHFEDAVSQFRYSGCYEYTGTTSSYYAKGITDQPNYLYAYSAPGCIYMNSGKSSSPAGIRMLRQFQLTAGLTYTVSVHARATSYNSRLIVGYGVDPNSITDIADIELSYCNSSNSDGYDYNYMGCWDLYTVSFTVPETGLYYVALGNNYVGTKTSAQIYIDDLTVAQEPTCATPAQQAGVNYVTQSTMRVTVPMDGAAEAQIGWALRTPAVSTADVLGTMLTTDGYATISGLNGSTGYAVYYRHICAEGDTSFWSPMTATVTTATDCFAPQDLGPRGAVNDHRALIGWGPVPEAESFDYELLLGNQVVAQGTATADSVLFDTLQASSRYTFRCHARCSDSTEWSSVEFETTRRSFAVPYVCTFEDSTALAPWLFQTNGTNTLIIGTDTAGVHSGERALYESSDGTTCSYTATETYAAARVPLEMTAGRYVVTADWRCAGRAGADYGRLFFVSYGSVLPSVDALFADNGTEMNGSVEWTRLAATVDIADEGMYELVVAAVADGRGVQLPAFAIDNISVTMLSCERPHDVSLLSVADTAARVRIERSAADVVVEYAVSASANSAMVAVWNQITDTASADTVALTGLTPNTTCYLHVRQACDSDNLSPAVTLPIHTRATAAGIPYICTFEQDAAHWSMTGSSVNRFVIGSDESSTGRHSLYVTDDGVFNEYNIEQESWAYAYAPLDLERRAYSADFEWRSVGENQYDYLRVFLLPDNIDIPDNAALNGLSFTTLPAGAIALDGDTGLAGSDDWSRLNADFFVPRAGTYNLVAAWHNDQNTGTQPPAAVDNINIDIVSCAAPDTSNVHLTVGTDSATLRVAETGGSVQIDYLVSTSPNMLDTAAYGRTAVGDTVILMTGLSPATAYWARLGTVCDSATASRSYTVVNFYTLCGINTQYPFIENFENYLAGSTYTGELEAHCWTTEKNVATSTHYVRSSGAHSGSKSLYSFNNIKVGVFSHQTYGLPEMDSLNGRSFSLWYKYAGSSTSLRPTPPSGSFIVGYLSNPNDVESFVSIADCALQSEWFQYRGTFQGLPANACPAFRTTGNCYVDDIRINDLVEGTVYHDTICYGQPYNDYGLSFEAGRINPGDTSFTFIREASETGVADSVITVMIHMHEAINVVVNDTVCAGTPYPDTRWNIPLPESRTYFETFTSSRGCDSAVVLNLTVLPTSELRYDTICQGDVYTLGSQNITAAGTYTDIITTAFGCPDTVTVHLAVVDTAVTTDAAICAGEVYQFEGQSYTQSGIYSIVTVGAHGCPVTKTLRLAVSSTDSVVNVTFCSGSQAQVADTVITTAGQYTLRRVNDAGCDIVYHITATVTPPVAGYATDYVCQGKPYWGYDLRGVTIAADTSFVTTSRTDDMCDSLTYVTITVSPTRYSDTYDTIQTGDSYTWHDNTYTQPGDYTVTLQDDLGCDSIVTLHLEVKDGVDNVCQTGSVRLVPNPARKGQAALLVTTGVAEIVRVEIINSFGAVVSSTEPHSTPIDIAAPAVAGVYHVRVVTRSGEVYVEKLIVE